MNKIYFIILGVLLLAGCSTGYHQAEKVAAGESTPTPNLTTFKIGETATDGKVRVTIHDVGYQKSIAESDNIYSHVEASEGKVFAIIDMTVENVQPNDISYVSTILQVELIDLDGYHYDWSFSGLGALAEKQWSDGDLSPGGKRRGRNVFEVAEDANGLQFKFKFDVIGTTTAIFELGNVTTLITSSGCITKWECEEWSNCSLEGIQTRICEDTNKCGEETGKPSELQSCTLSGEEKAAIYEELYAESSILVNKVIDAGNFEVKVVDMGNYKGLKYITWGDEIEQFRLSLEVKNVGSEADYFWGSDITLVDDLGNQYEWDYEDKGFGNVFPSATKKGYILFDKILAEGVSTITIIVDTGEYDESWNTIYTQLEVDLT